MEFEQSVSHSLIFSTSPLQQPTFGFNHPFPALTLTTLTLTSCAATLLPPSSQPSPRSLSPTLSQLQAFPPREATHVRELSGPSTQLTDDLPPVLPFQPCKTDGSTVCAPFTACHTLGDIAEIQKVEKMYPQVKPILAVLPMTTPLCMPTVFLDTLNTLAAPAPVACDTSSLSVSPLYYVS